MQEIQTQTPVHKGISEEENIDLVSWVYRILANWYWFLGTILFMLLVAWVYLRYTTPVYQSTAKVLVSDEKKGSLGLAAMVFSDLDGAMGLNSSVDNEVEILKTYDLMRAVVGKLNAHVEYRVQGRVKEVETLDPFILLEVITPIDSIKSSTKFSVRGNENRTLNVKSVKFELAEVKLGELTSIPDLGYVRFVKNHSVLDTTWESFAQSRSLEMLVKTPAAQTSNFRKQLTVSATNKQASIIDLSFNHSIPQKGELILNTLINTYIERSLEDKNTIADSTLAFIDDRLRYVGQELGMAEERIQTFKQESQLADISAQSQVLIQNASEFAKDLAAVESQLLMLDEVDKYLADTRNLRVVPTTVSGSDPTFSALVQNYNKLLMERERLLLSSTEANPYVVNIDQQIASLRADMRSNLNNSRRQLQVTLNTLQRQSNKIDAEIRRVPATERGFIDLSRQQQIKQELYLYLQQKWEETAISKTANISQAKIIDSPRTASDPISPKKNIIYLAALLLGFILPLAVLYIQDLLNIRIRTKEDVSKRSSLPIIGEIGHNDSNAKSNLVVTKTSRSPIAEQFRALRTNLDFYSNKDKNHTILFTSSMSGEGKSFVVVNLGIALSLSGKKVILLELDLRKPTLSAKLGKSNSFGFSNYVIKNEITVADIIQTSAEHPGLHIISSGPIPPNPAELLLHPRTAHLFEELKRTYDYIVIDSPPIGLVSDAQLLASYADTSIYVVRQHVTYKKQLDIANEVSDAARLPRVHLLVNDINISRGYGYGGYGYGYGYGYYAEETKKKKWYWPF